MRDPLLNLFGCSDELELGHGDPFQGLESLDELIRNLYGKSNYPYWQCRDGRMMRIEDMTDSHLTNAIALVRRARPTKTTVLALTSLEADQVRRAMTCSYGQSLV